jgi:hypothetical protein
VYLDITGNIRYTNDEGDSQRLICIKPDVLFLDSQGKIILLIELCATHKVDLEKRAKLQLLKIDAVEVRIPPVPTKDKIGPIFTIHDYTEWLFNYEQSITKFDPNTHKIKGVSGGPSKGRSYLQQKEDEKCRAFRLRNLIRQLERYMESGEFGVSQKRIEADIDQIKLDEHRTEQELRGLNTRAREAAQNRIGSSYELECQERGEYKDLEARYRSKKGQLIEEEDELQSRFRAEEAKIVERILMEEAEFGNEFYESEITITEQIRSEETEYAELLKQARIAIVGRIEIEEGEYASSLHSNRSAIEQRVTDLRSRITNIRILFDPIRAEEERINAEEGNFERKVRRFPAEFESAQRTHLEMSDIIGRTKGDRDGIAKEIRRIEGIKSKYISIRDQTFRSRNNN